MVDMLLAGDRAVVRVPDQFGKDYHCETYKIYNDQNGKPWDKIARHITTDKVAKVWFDGRNYRVGRYSVIARA